MRELTACEIDNVSGGSIIMAALTGIGAVAGGVLGAIGGVIASALTLNPIFLAAAPAGLVAGGLVGLVLGGTLGIIV